MSVQICLSLCVCPLLVFLRFRDAEISEEDLCSLMEEFVKSAQRDKHKEEGWPSTAYGTTKVYYPGHLERMQKGGSQN